jgi:hypothetical protein
MRFPISFHGLLVLLAFPSAARTSYPEGCRTAPRSESLDNILTYRVSLLEFSVSPSVGAVSDAYVIACRFR